ncbi:MAG: hypothetical protein R8K53_05875 [Mariprofundaceae bacterium]
MPEAKQDMIMQTEDLYREELFTDLRLGSIRRLIPVTADGSDDTAREVRYSGQAQVMTPGGAIPISFELQASNIGEAVEAFGPAAEKALDETARELEEMRRRSASGIVLPGGGGSTNPGGGIIQS